MQPVDIEEPLAKGGSFALPNLLGTFRDGCHSRVESDFRMRSIAERLVGGSAAAA